MHPHALQPSSASIKTDYVKNKRRSCRTRAGPEQSSMPPGAPVLRRQRQSNRVLFGTLELVHDQQGALLALRHPSRIRSQEVVPLRQVQAADRNALLRKSLGVLPSGQRVRRQLRYSMLGLVRSLDRPPHTQPNPSHLVLLRIHGMT